MLWRDALIMYDRATRSLWSQVNGKAVAGPMKGRRLEELPSELTTWGEWKRRHPNTLVLLKPPLSGSPYEDYFADPERIGVRGSTNPDRRLPGKTLVVGLERDGRFATVPLHLLETRRILNTNALGAPLVLTASAAYDRRIADRTLTFERAGEGTLRDHESGSIWSLDTGEATSGPMQGRRLTRVSGKLVYWGVWARFHPQSELIAR